MNAYTLVLLACLAVIAVLAVLIYLSGRSRAPALATICEFRPTLDLILVEGPALAIRAGVLWKIPYGWPGGKSRGGW